MAGVFAASVLLSENDSYITITSKADSIISGKVFQVDVYAYAAVPVNAVDIKIKIPTDKVTVQQIDTGASVVTLWTREPYVERGTVYLQGGTFRRGFVGKHLIASLDLLAKAEGNATFEVDDIVFLAGDGSGSSVPVATKDGTLVVAVSTADGLLDADVRIEIVSDINGDGAVTLADIQAFLAAWGKPTLIYDFNNDKRMNFTDFAIILAHSFIH